MLEVQDLIKSYLNKCKELGCTIEEESEKEGYIISKGTEEIFISLDNLNNIDEMKLNFYKSEETSDEFVIQMMNLFAETLNSLMV